ncbi:MAG: hypothetical protein ACM3QZ_11110 [Solirubrobacterales bacterium]
MKHTVTLNGVDYNVGGVEVKISEITMTFDYTPDEYIKLLTTYGSSALPFYGWITDFSKMMTQMKPPGTK